MRIGLLQLNATIGAFDANRARLEEAYREAVQRGAETGVYIDGPCAWDGYAAAAVCDAGVKSLESGQPVKVEMVARDSIKGA